VGKRRTHRRANQNKVRDHGLSVYVKQLSHFLTLLSSLINQMKEEEEEEGR